MPNKSKNTIRVKTGEDFGCEMTAEDVSSYAAFVEERLEQIYGVTATLEVFGIGETECKECPDSTNAEEIAALVAVDLWEEWCARD